MIIITITMKRDTITAVILRNNIELCEYNRSITRNIGSIKSIHPFFYPFSKSATDIKCEKNDNDYNRDSNLINFRNFSNLSR